MTISDCFRILDLPRNACLNDLKLAYRSKAKKYHPDRKGGNSRQFTLLHEAYTFLLDNGLFQKNSINRGSAEWHRKDAEDRARRDTFQRAAEERIKREAERRAAKDKACREAEEKTAREKERIEMKRRAAEKRAAFEKAHRIAELKAAEERRLNSSSHRIFALGEILSKSVSHSEKINAINSLVTLKRKSAYPFLKTALYDSSEIVVLASIKAIGQLKIIQAEPELSSLMSSGSINIKKAILDTVMLIGKKNHYMNIINLALSDNHLIIRQKAEALNKRIYG